MFYVYLQIQKLQFWCTLETHRTNRDLRVKNVASLRHILSCKHCILLHCLDTSPHIQKIAIWLYEIILLESSFFKNCFTLVDFFLCQCIMITDLSRGLKLIFFFLSFSVLFLFIKQGPPWNYLQQKTCFVLFSLVLKNMLGIELKSKWVCCILFWLF